jgi:methyl-accepting chemotaxis protein
MEKTLLKKYLRITSVVILISFLILSFALLIFLSEYWESERRDLLRKNAESVAHIAAESAISVSRNQYQLDGVRMQTFIMAFADNISSDIFVTQTDGQMLLAAYGSGGTVDGTQKVGNDIMQQALEDRYSAQGTLGGIYSRPYYIVGVPIRVDNLSGGQNIIGVVFAAYNIQSLQVFRLDVLKMIFFAAVAAFMVSFCLVWLFTFRMVQPLRKMASAARSFGEGNFTVRVPVTSFDEIGLWAIAFNNRAFSISPV